jgi:cobalt-zinc-cadmium efflux system outer membrane protein
MLGLLGTVAGCRLLDTPPPYSVSDQLDERTGISPAQFPSGPALGEDGAVALALNHNAAFREILCDLGIARADVIDAGIIPNPELRFFAPVDPRPLESYLEFPIDTFILRPKRVAIAKFEAERIRETVIQSGLNLARDVRVAYADVLLALDRQTIARDNETLRRRIASIAEKRLKAGDASPADVAAARTDVERSAQEFQRLDEDVAIALERLRILLGCTQPDCTLTPYDLPLPALPDSSESMLERALQTRPDALAVSQAVASAEEKVKLAHCDWIRFFGTYYTYSDLHVVQHRPGFRMTVPIFNWNQGKIARADADLEKARAQQRTVHDRIVLDVRQAFLQCQQAQLDLERWRTKVRPAVDDAVAKSDRAYQAGDVALTLVLETSRQILDTRVREAQLKAELRKSFAELERSVGQKISPPPTLEIELP